MKKCAMVLVAISIATCSPSAKTHRLEVSPAFLINLADGHSGKLMGSAVSADYSLSHWAALRTTIGFTKERYYPSELDYRDANYGFWLSAAPILQANLGSHVRPYIALLGTITGVGRRLDNNRPISGLELSPYQTISDDPLRGETLFSFGATIGSKFKVAGPISVFGEVTHYFYSNVSTTDNYYPGAIAVFGRPLDFERNPTYVSLGLSYALQIGKRTDR